MIIIWDNEKNIFVKQCKACAYEYAEEISEEGYYESVIGDEDFIELGLTTRQRDYGNISEEKLYACPKCGTVHIEI